MSSKKRGTNWAPEGNTEGREGGREKGKKERREEGKGRGGEIKWKKKRKGKKKKYLGINLTKHIKDPYAEYCETLMKEIRQDLNKWRESSW